MKALLTILLLSVCSLCFGQAPKKEILKDSITFDEYEKFHIDEWNQKVKDFNAETKAMEKFYGDIEKAKGKHIDFSRASQGKDSIRITSNGILYIYKPKKK